MIWARRNELAGCPALWVPQGSRSLSYDEACRWYANIAVELELAAWPADMRTRLESYYREAGLLNRPLKRAFFDHHYARSLAIAVREFFKDRPRGRQRILDLGCGFGTQSLLFALLGAQVTGIDVDAAALQIANKRRDLYAEAAARPLSLSFLCTDALACDYGRYGPFDAIYSLFAFNMMQPSTRLLDRLSPHLARGAVFIVQDGNRQMLYARAFRRRAVLSPAALRQALRERGFRDVRSIPGYALPPVAWWVLPVRVATAVDSVLGRSPLLAGSYLHVAHLPLEDGPSP